MALKERLQGELQALLPRENQRLIDVPKSLETGTVVLWEDWQGNGRGLKA